GPDRLTLRPTAEGVRLFTGPVREPEKRRAGAAELARLTLDDGDRAVEKITGEVFDIEAEFAAGTARQFGIRARGQEV
ncbi:MAG TPA: hypothetical protein VIL46_16465, partial [Gemmataceae bacterium]